MVVITNTAILAIATTIATGAFLISLAVNIFQHEQINEDKHKLELMDEKTKRHEVQIQYLKEKLNK